MVRYPELYAQLIAEILNEGNFNLTTEDWIQSLGYKTNPNTQEDELIKAMKTFDKMVNPFMDSSIALVDVKDYIPNLLISVKTEKWEKEEETALEITNKTNGDTVSYFRNPNNLCYQMRCTLGDNKFMEVFHTIENQENNLKEEIEIQYWGLQENVTYHCNLKEDPKEMREIILIHLQKALEISKTITIENMENKNKEQDYKRERKQIKK